ncbi:MAG: hypothetical protein HYY84_02415 [Deltaproteobacteria bacterium]|nr:hypothetical protein [Deltaproteobacteria bacterium]
MTALIARDDLEARIRAAVAQTGGERLCAFAVIRSRSVTRFADSSIHQAFDESNIRIEFRSRGHHGVSVTAATSALDAPTLAQTAARVIATAPAQSPPLSAETSRDQGTHDDSGWSLATTASSHEERADALRAAFGTAAPAVSFAGVFGARTLSFLHLRRDAPASFARISKAYFNVFGVGPRGDEGFDGCAHRDIAELNIDASVRTATERALRASAPKRRVCRGPIEAILAPDAVEELMSWAAPIGFGGKMFVEGAGFSAGRLGEPMFDAALTIHDDGLSDDPLAVRMPFDCEGTPKRCVTLVDRGRVVGIAHDSTTADLAGTVSTGHAPHDDVEAGPLPLHLFIAPGDASVDDLVRGVEHGLWITRFHYVNGYVNPREGAMTGLTRGGTFLIERGKITDPIETARFSDRFPAIFSSIARIGAERRLIPSWLHDAAGSVVPAIHVRALNLT